jgi:S-(hydroxymethyl)glutathione dehydrogenase/alcohol dehydrogenase
VYAIDNVNEKEPLVLSQGANHFLTSTNELPEKVDLIIDTTGSPNVISEAFKSLSNEGRMILVGQPAPGAEVVIPNAIQLFNGIGQSIRATQGGETSPQNDIPRYIRLFKSRSLGTAGLITHRYPLEEVNEAFKKLITGGAGRIMISMGEKC